MRYSSLVVPALLFMLTSSSFGSIGARQPFTEGTRMTLSPNSASSLSSVPQISSGEPYTIGVWYFTAWNDLNDYQATNAATLYGWRDPWGGVREYGSGMDPLQLGVNFSNREPLLGYYDLLDQQVMDAHIQQAASRGISYFAFYWYWDTVKNREANVSAPMQRFVSSPYKGLMKFILAPIQIGNSMTMTMWTNSVVPYMVNNYIADPSYLRTIDGRPIISDFDFGFSNTTQHAQAISVLRNAVLQKTGENPVILFIAQVVHTSGDLLYAQQHLDLDGFMCFSFAPEQPGESYSNTVSRYVPTWVAQDTTFYVPCGMTGEDQRPWWYVGEGFGLQPNQMSWDTNFTVAGFQTHLTQLKGYIDNNTAKTAKMLTLYAWNEWGEGGAIEPSYVGGYQYLDTIQRVFGLTSNSHPPAPSQDRAVLLNVTAPKILETAQSATVSIILKNRGSTTWTNRGGYELGSQNPQDNSIWGLSRVTLSANESIAPGQTKTFSFVITAPSTPGTYNFRFTMVRNQSGWFGDSTPTLRIKIFESLTSTTTTTSTTAAASTTSLTTTTPSTITGSNTSSSTRTTFVPTTARSVTSISSTTSYATTESGGIPEFPYQVSFVAILTILLVASYLIVRGRALLGHKVPE